MYTACISKRAKKNRVVFMNLSVRISSVDSFFSFFFLTFPLRYNSLWICFPHGHSEQEWGSQNFLFFSRESLHGFSMVRTMVKWLWENQRTLHSQRKLQTVTRHGMHGYFYKEDLKKYVFKGILRDGRKCGENNTYEILVSSIMHYL